MLIDSEFKEWYQNWFNTEYYHILYGNRSNTEASSFVDNLLSASIVIPGQTALDLGCGKGRHAVYLSSKGIHTTGVDLSENNIQCAQQEIHSNLRFIQADMRDAHTVSEYDLIFNLFTSFGYFNDDEDHIKTLKSCWIMLKPGGELWIDFMNSAWVKDALKQETRERQIREPYIFDIRKTVESGFVVKMISIYKTENHELLGTFFERVRLFSLDDFTSMLDMAGFSLQEVYGDYNLQKFNKKSSSRMIMRAKKSV